MAVNNYPSVSSVINLSQIPESLYFLHDGLTSFFDKLYYRNLQVIRSLDGTSISIVIEVVIDKSLGVEIPPSTGFRLLFNPDYQAGNMTIVPLSFTFEWGILKYLKIFDYNNFSFDAEAVANLLFQITNIQDTSLISIICASSFADEEDPLNALAVYLNSNYAANITLPLNEDYETALNEIKAAVQGNVSDSFRDIVFNDFINDSDSGTAIENINSIFGPYTGGQTVSQLRSLIIPYLRATVSLALGLEIPRYLLLPMKPDASGDYVVEDNVNVKTTLIFDIGDVYFDSRSAQIGFNDNFTLNFQQPYDKAQIANTPLTIHFENARYQMIRKSGTGSSSEYRNIISIDEIEVELPSVFTANSGNPSIFGKNIVIDSDNGFSGTIGIEGGGNLQYTFVNGLSIELVSFDVTFLDGSITSSAINGTITIPSFQYNPLNIEIDIENGFVIKVLIPPGNGIPVIDNDNILLTLDGLTIGEQESVWQLGFAASFLMKRELPLLTKIFPEQIKVSNFLYKTDGSQLEYNFEIDWTSGTQITGNNESGISVIFPVTLNIGDGLFRIDGLQLKLITGDDNSLDFEIMLQDVGFSLGPIEGEVDGLGASIKIKKDEQNGNLGPFNVDLEFVGPNGIAVEINSGPVSGGGFLYIGDHQYLGAVGLSFKDKISINAVGILTTQLPGGASGYSLLVIITVEFTPIQLGMGFTLNGVGGLLGLNRTMDPDVLRDGIKNNTLDNILFPEDIFDNALTIISNIGKAFPAQKDQFIIGPMAKIGWGTPTLLTIELGIMIELPNPVRLAILGIVKAILPTEDKDILRIQVNFLGIIDFDNKYISFDASLYDSRILTFGLFGDMALRIYWGDQPNFLLSVGGFHPKFTPPPLNLPQMTRLTIVLANENSLQIHVETYFAITSNSVQFGAKVYAMAHVWKIQAVGALWFDILFQFSPFHFIADMGVMFAIKMGNKTILSIFIDLSLEGPHPWVAQGTGSFKILFVKVKVSFNKTFGQADTEALEAAAVDDKFTDALQNKDNWQGIVPDRNNQLVSYKQIDAAQLSDLVVDPAGRLRFSQNLLPLNTVMEKLGNSAISDYNKYSITGITGMGTYGISPVQDYFARNEFFNMSDDDKLSKPSYELFNSGIIAGSDDIVSSYAVHRLCDYEQVTIDTGYRRLELRWPISFNSFNVHMFGNYVGRSRVGIFDKITTQSGPKQVMLNHDEDEFVLINRNDMSVVSTGGYSSSVEAERALQSNLTSQPAVASDWVVANRFELDL